MEIKAYKIYSISFSLPGRTDGSELSGGIATAEPGTQGRQGIGSFEVTQELIDTVAALPNKSHLCEEETTLSILLRLTPWKIFFFFSFLPEVHQVQCQRAKEKKMSWIVRYLPGGSRWADCRQSRPPAKTWLAGGRNCVRPIRNTHAHNWIDSSRTQFFSKISHRQRHPDENKFLFSSRGRPAKKQIQHWMNDECVRVCSSCWMGKQGKATGLCGAQTNPADEIDFSGVCMYTRKHILDRCIQMATKWVKTTHAVQNTIVPMWKLSIPRPPDFSNRDLKRTTTKNK